MNPVRKWVLGPVGVIDAALARLTPRERWLSVAAILALLAVAAAQALQWSIDQRQRYAVAQADLSLARQRLAQRDRPGLDSFDQAQIRALESWSEEGRSLWLVRLRIEQRILTAAQDSGLSNAKIDLAEAVEAGGAPLLRAEITGPYNGGAVAGLLKRLAAGDKTYILDSLQVTQVQSPSYKLVLLFPVRIDAAPRDVR